MSRIIWILLAGTLVVGCGDDPKPPPATPVAPAPIVKTDSDGEGAVKDTKGPVNIDERIAKMCNLPNANFSFDSAAVSPSAKGLLKAIATCFKDGPGKGKGLNIVGHADPRGETDYNRALGQKRAGAVAGFLTTAGLADGRIETSSRGEMDATGTDQTGWQRDRRVEILLAD